MRLRRLDFLAWGPFERTSVPFDPDPKLEVIYGPNEGGKSSALRGVRALFFGIPQRTTDNHRFDYGSLRIGAQIVSDHNEVVEVVRRKALKKTLIKPDGSAFDSDTLVSGYSEEEFDHIFGFDHETLRKSGEELTKGKGAYASTLWAATTGYLGAQRLLEALNDEAQAIFGPMKRSCTINKLLDDHQHAVRRINENVTTPEAWKGQRTALADLDATLAALEAEEASLQKSRRRAQFRLEVAELKARVSSLDEQLGPLADVPVMTSEQVARLSAAIAAHQGALRDGAAVQARCTTVAAELADLGTPAPLLAEEHAIDATTRAGLEEAPLLLVDGHALRELRGRCVVQAAKVDAHRKVLGPLSSATVPPSKDEADGWIADQQQMCVAKEALRRDEAAATSTLAEVAQALASLEQSVPAPDALHNVRATRDAAWVLFRRGDADESAFLEASSNVDKVVDEMLASLGALAEAKQLRREWTEKGNRVDQFRRALDRLEGEQRAFDATLVRRFSAWGRAPANVHEAATWAARLREADHDASLLTELNAALGEAERAFAARWERVALAAQFSGSCDLDCASILADAAKKRLSLVDQRAGERNEREVRRATLRTKLDELRADQAAAEANVASHRLALDAALKEVGLETEEAFVKIRDQVSRANALRSQRDREALALREKARLEPEFASAVGEAVLSAGDERAQRESIELRLEECRRKRDEVLASRVGCELGLRRIDQASSAADFSLDASAIAAEIGEQARQYARLRAAHILLRASLERNRQDYESPVLRRASTILSGLTRGAYGGLCVELGDKGDPELKAIARDCRAKAASDLSEGTRNQMFLALKLASVEQACRDRAPLPLVLDDVLVHFDDERSEATLETLAELSKSTQVLLFTHHRRVADFASTLHGARVREL